VKEFNRAKGLKPSSEASFNIRLDPKNPQFNVLAQDKSKIQPKFSGFNDSTIQSPQKLANPHQTFDPSKSFDASSFDTFPPPPLPLHPKKRNLI
jgi:hypothetical protein